MSKTALIIIDVQLAVTDGAWKMDEVLAAIQGLIARARTAGAPVIYLQHNSATYAPMNKGADTWAIHPAIAPRPGDLVIHKTASDAFVETSLEADLERLGVDRVVMTGLQTEFCVDATCRAALSRGLNVVLAADAHTTGDAVTPAETTIRHHNYALGNLAHPRLRIAVEKSAEVTFA